MVRFDIWYDIHFLIQDTFTKNFVESPEFQQMVEKVIACDQEAYKSTPWLDEPLSNSSIFSNLQDLWPSLKGTYYGNFKAMVVDSSLPSIKDLNQTVKIIYQQLATLDQNKKRVD